MSDVMQRIEDCFLLYNTLTKLGNRIHQIKTNLESTDGTVFERGHESLGKMLGYVSKNSDGQGAPDPYWIVNPNLVIVAEDKIYKEQEKIKSIPITDTKEARGHEDWLRAREDEIMNITEVITIFVTNSISIDEYAVIHAGNIYYVNRNEFLQWATKVLTVIRDAYTSFNQSGEYEWRRAMQEKIRDNQITLLDFTKFVQKKKIEEL